MLPETKNIIFGKHILSFIISDKPELVNNFIEYVRSTPSPVRFDMFNMNLHHCTFMNEAKFYIIVRDLPSYTFVELKEVDLVTYLKFVGIL